MCSRSGLRKECRVPWASELSAYVIFLLPSCTVHAPSQMYHFHLLKVAGRCPAMIFRIWWLWRDQPHDHVISDNHQVVSRDQVLCLYQDPVAYKEMFFKMHIVLHLWMVWHSFRIPGVCVMILPLEIATISTWHSFPPLIALIPQGPPNCMMQVVDCWTLAWTCCRAPFCSGLYSNLCHFCVCVCQLVHF